jgi:glutathione S-transferase
MNQWISAVNSYYYPYMIYHVTHERLVFPELGIDSHEKVVAHALPKVELGLGVMERELSHGQDYLLGPELMLADFYMLPSTLPSLSPMKARLCTPNFLHFAAGGSGWRICRRPESCVRAYRHAIRFRMRASGRIRIARNTDVAQPDRKACRAASPWLS